MGYWSFLDTGLVPCIIPGCFGRRRGKRTRFGGFFYVWLLPVFPGCQAGQAAGLSSICWVKKLPRRAGRKTTHSNVFRVVVAENNAPKLRPPRLNPLPRIARLAEHF